jgi:Ca2+-binding EF-hand superfamily protein
MIIKLTDDAFAMLFSGDGNVDFDEFLIMMQRRKSTTGSGTELLKVFNVS